MAAGLLVALVAVGLGGAVHATGGTATYSSGGSNNWSSNNRWIWSGNAQCTYNGSSGTKCVPGVDANASGAAVIIANSVSVDTSIGGGTSTIASITINGGTTTVGSGNTVATTGDLKLNGGNFTASSGNITVGAALNITSGTYTPGSGQLAPTTTSLSGGSFAGGSATGTIYVSGAMQLSGTHTFTASSSASATITAGSFSQSNTSNGFTGGGGAMTVSGDLAISGGTFVPPTGTLTVTGKFNKTGGSYTTGGTVVLNSTGSAAHTFGSAVFDTATIGTASGLVGWWKLDETSGTALADSSAYGNSGTLSGTLTSTSSAGGFSFTNSNAITFDGSTVSASLGITGMPDPDAVQSISLWVKLVNTSGQQNFIVLTDKVSGAVQLGIKDGNLKVWGWGAVDVVSATAPGTGAWHHIAYTYDGTNNTLFIDGVSKGTSTTAHQSGSIAKVYLGTWTPNNDMLNGSLDDVRVYNRSLSSTEVTTLAGKSNLTSPAGGTHTLNDLLQTSNDFTIGTGTVTGAGNLSVGGSFVNSGGTFSGSGTVTLKGTSSGLVLVPNGSTINTLTVNGVGGTYDFGGTVTVTNDFTITNGTVTGTDPMSVGGNWSNSGTFQGTGAVTLTGTGSKTITSNGGRFNSLTISGGGTYTMQDRFSASGGTVTVSSGTLAAGSQTARVGQFSFSGTGSFSAGTGTVIIDGTSSQTLATSTSASSFSGLRVEPMSETGLVGYWKLDEGSGSIIYDASGTGNSGTLSSAGATWSSSLPTAPVFEDRKSVSFNGSTGYALLGTTSLPANNAAQTIAFWANVTSTAGTQTMVALNDSNNAVEVGIRAVSAVQKLAVVNNAGTVLISATAPSTGAWHHIAYTYDGAGAQTLYVDGVATTATATNDTGSVSRAYLGTSAPPSTEMYNGALDDLRVYNVALTSTQVAALYAGRYAGTGGGSTVSLGANTAVSGALELDNGTLSGNGKTMSASLATSVAAIKGGTYSVGSAAQTFSGGLTVSAGGSLTLASSGGSVNIGSGKVLTMDGTLNASSASAFIQVAISGTYDFWVGSANGATPTLNITGLGVKNTTANGMRINGNGSGTTTATTTFTNFNNVAFTNGTSGGSLLQIYASSLALISNGCTFDASTTYTVKLVGDGFTTGNESTQTRALFGGATCSAGTCQNTKSDDDSNNDGVPSTTTNPGGSVVQFLSNAPTDTAGTIEGFPTAAFSWNDGSYYATYVAFHDTSSTVDTVYVRDSTGAAKYSWSTGTSETIVGTPMWTTEGTTVATEKHYVYVALASGKVYRLYDNGTSLAPDTTTTGWSTSPYYYDCGGTITTELAIDSTNLYWGGQKTSGAYVLWALGQADRSVPGWSPVQPSIKSSPTISPDPAVTSAAPDYWMNSGTTYMFMGETGYIVKVNVTAGNVAEYNSNPGSGKSVLGRIIAVDVGTARVLAGDDGGKFWSIAPGTFTGTNKQWSYTALAGTDQFKSSPFYDFTGGYVQFGSEGGRLVVLNGSSGAVMTGYPMTTLTTDPIRTAVLYRAGIIAVGTTTGKLFFVNRRTTSTGTPALKREYYFGSTEQVSGISYDPNSNKYLVTTSSSTTKDGRLFTIDASDSVLTDSDGNL